MDDWRHRITSLEGPGRPPNTTITDKDTDPIRTKHRPSPGPSFSSRAFVAGWQGARCPYGLILTYDVRIEKAHASSMQNRC